MNRREAMKLVVPAAMVASAAEAVTEIWVNPGSGADGNVGTPSSPLKTVAEAARRVNRSEGEGAVDIVLTEGVHVVGESIVLRPERRKFTKGARLTIRAEVLPDEAGWNSGRMPTLIHTMPLQQSWNGRPDPLGGVADGMLVETSHVTVRGLKILGLPVVETPKAGQIRRLYGINRFRKELEDLEVGQCVFLGDDVIAPLHVGIIANGDGVDVHHCVFRGMKISVVYWTPGSKGHVMRNCVCDGVYGSGVWTSGIANGFEYRNNVVTGCNYVWTAQGGASALADAAGRGGTGAARQEAAVHYRVVDSFFGGNRRLAGSGTGARLEYADIDGGFLEMVGTKQVTERVAMEVDATKLSYLHPVAGTEAAKVGAGLFLKPLG